MNIYRELEPIFFHYQFSDCSKNKNIKYYQLNETDYLVVRVFAKGKIADLLLESYQVNQYPCSSRPVKDEVIKQGFSINDGNLIEGFLKKQ